MNRTTLRDMACLLCLVCSLLSAGCRKNVPLTPENVTIVPVTTPTVYSYGPCSGEYVITVSTIADNKTDQTICYLRYSVIRQGDTLIWHEFIPKVVHNEKELNPMVPLFDITADTNLYGELGKIKTTSPLIEALGNKAPAELLDKLKSLNGEKNHYFPPFPGKGIISGQPLRSISLNAPSGASYEGQNAVVLLLNGECLRNNVTYVAGSFDNDLVIKTTEGIRVFFSAKGFGFFRKDTMETETIFMEMIFRDPLGREVTSAKMTITRNDP